MNLDRVVLAHGAVWLRGFARPVAEPLAAGLEQIAASAPFRHMSTPGGRRMSVAMTNCGALGWVSDGSGYRYDACDPHLINRYEPGARLSLHQDKDEHDFDAPIVSVSLGLPAVFQFGGMRRAEKPGEVAQATVDQLARAAET